MAFTNLSPNMNLPVPQVGLDPGPQFAQDINNCLTIVDGHNHAPGYGIQINPAGININSDLTFNNNNLTNARSLRLQPQSTVLSGVLDLGCLYEVVNDLYYNDGVGNQVRITQSGGVAGTPGSISNLAPPASASYVSANETFVFQSDANTPANLDGASFILRDLVANSFGLTLSPPASLASDYTITLPTLPGSTLPVTLDPAGNLAASQITTAQIANGAVTGAQIAAQTITQGLLALRTTGTTVAAGGVAISASSGNFANSSNIFVDVVTVTITTTGRPVFVGLMDDGTASDSRIEVTTSAGIAGLYQILRDGTPISLSQLSSASASINSPPGSIFFLDVGATAGTHTYLLQAANNTTGSGSTFVVNCSLVAYEL